MGEPTGVVRQLVVHPAAWQPLVGLLRDRGLDVARIPTVEDEDLPTYVIVLPQADEAASDG